ncbi:hypothetical protein [Bacteriovorax sp. DB6_IX]|uniref:hypothetical protein n=1 Tax=Bacteriovorax sp. DB6_IX TaxID=1353530 RepID=UPI00038A5250|nr:hypothetical protein [Bacteriovorax sp. DB6_IX]EQC52599.1 hypothetical protein M901_0101 [Bacteriovorax sp. DB6_IX]
MSLNLTNWNYSYYNSEFFKALISIVGTEKDGEFVQLYCPTVIDDQDTEVFQKDFEDLQEAIDFINKNYSHWSFIDPARKDGCSSCSAH